MRRLRFEARYRSAEWAERAAMFCVWHLPRWAVRWAVVRAYASAWATAGNKTPDELTYLEVYDGAMAR